jgi:uncharacterized protein involved in outer membrane biogenesis
MAMSVLRRIGWAVAAIFGPLAALVVAAPHLVDVEAYKPALIQAVKEATGRELVIDGPMKLSMFPLPRISARQVHFANAMGAEGAQMLDVRWIGASPSWAALLKGQVEVGRLTLYQPTIVLETDSDGVPNWQFKPGAGAVQPEGAPASGFHLAVGQLRIVQGTVNYTNPQTKQTLKAEKVEATASVGSLHGPFSIVGTATVNGVPLTVDFSLSESRAGGHETAFNLKVLSGTLDFRGTVSAVAANADIKGHLAVSTGGLTDFVAAVVRASGQGQPSFGKPVIGPFTFDGGIEYSPTRLAVTDFKMALGGETASGTLAFEEGKTPSLKGHVALPKVEVEKWLALLATPGAFTPPGPAPQPAKAPQPAPAPQPAKAPAAGPAATTSTATAPASLSPFPKEMDISLSLDIAEVLYRQGTVRDATVAVEIHKGVITVPQLRAVLPGDMVLQASTAASPAPAVSPAKPGTTAANTAPNPLQATGEISLVGPKLRDTLAWLEIDVSDVPADKLQQLDLKGKLASTANGVQVSDLVVVLDGQRATGSGSLSLSVPLTATATLQLDRFDLDAYLPIERPAAATTAAPAATANTPAAVVPPASAPSDKKLPVFSLKAKVAKLVFRKQTLGGVEGDASVQGNLLKLNSVKVADLLGAKMDLNGSVTDFGTAPRFDLTFNANLPDTDKVIDYVGLPKFINGKIGAASASGGVVGTMDAFVLRNATVTMLGSTARATGALAFGQNFRFDFSSFALQTQEASRLLAVATGRAQGGIGAMSVAGTFKGDAQRVIFNGDLAALGTPMKGQIDATLGKRPNITANLRVPGTLDFDQWLGVSAGPAPAAAAQAVATAAPGAASAASAAPAAPTTIPIGPPRAATGKPIDLSALRAFDATLNLETSAIAIASLRVTYADLQASLKNGMFRIAKLTGQFYGGAVDFNGTIDASKNALALDLKGNLQGIYFGELLRGTAGTNSFGNEHLKVAVEGKITVMDIEVTGSGTSPEQIRNSLKGRGQMTGYLYPAVAGGSLGFASFATGVGSVFSTEMGFNSAVLAAFINHQSPIAGELLLDAGTVNLPNHTVQGQNATAVIKSHTNLTAATTDTTIALDTGRRGPADYVVTVKGPVSSPTMSTRGGN